MNLVSFEAVEWEFDFHVIFLLFGDCCLSICRVNVKRRGKICRVNIKRRCSICGINVESRRLEVDEAIREKEGEGEEAKEKESGSCRSLLQWSN